MMFSICTTHPTFVHLFSKRGHFTGHPATFTFCLCGAPTPRPSHRWLSSAAMDWTLAASRMSRNGCSSATGYSKCSTPARLSSILPRCLLAIIVQVLSYHSTVVWVLMATSPGTHVMRSSCEMYCNEPDRVTRRSSVSLSVRSPVATTSCSCSTARPCTARVCSWANRTFGRRPRLAWRTMSTAPATSSHPCTNPATSMQGPTLRMHPMRGPPIRSTIRSPRAVLPWWNARVRPRQRRRPSATRFYHPMRALRRLPERRRGFRE